MITIQNAKLTVAVSLLGAELQSVKDGAGKERLWQGDAQFWTGRAPVLFPFAGSLKDGYCLHEGKKWHLPQHGFARKSLFQVKEQHGDSVTLLLDTPHAEYPFAYALLLRYTLVENAIKVEYIVQNNGETTMYYGIGCHEAYALPETFESYQLLFDEKETLVRNLLEGAQITTNTEVLSTDTREFPLKEKYFYADDSIVLLHTNSKALTLETTKSNDKIRVEYPGFDNLLIWKKENAPYICIEPWVNPPEYTTSNHILAEKPGIVALPAKQEKIHTHIITIL